MVLDKKNVFYGQNKLNGRPDPPPFFFTTSDYTNFSQQNLPFKFYTLDCNNTIKAGGSTKRAQNVGWSG